MATTRKNYDVFPSNTYNGTFVGYITSGNDLINCLQVRHPAEGSLAVEASLDFASENADKLWTPIRIKLQGTSDYATQIDFTEDTSDFIEFTCFPYAFTRVILTGLGGTYRVLYYAPTRQAEL